MDSVYMSRGTPNLITMWTPFGDVGTAMGTIAVMEGSHRLPAFDRLRKTYGAMDAEAERLQGTGWFTTDAEECVRRFGASWLVTDFRAGDALFFTMHTMHMSTTNVTGLARISCDTRWQLATEPADPRCVLHDARCRCDACKVAPGVVVIGGCGGGGLVALVVVVVVQWFSVCGGCGGENHVSDTMLPTRSMRSALIAAYALFS